MQDYIVANARIRQGLEDVFQVRLSLGLPIVRVNADTLTKVPADLGQTPPDLDQNYSTVRQAVGDLMQAVAQLGSSRIPGI